MFLYDDSFNNEGKESKLFIIITQDLSSMIPKLSQVQVSNGAALLGLLDGNPHPLVTAKPIMWMIGITTERSGCRTHTSTHGSLYDVGTFPEVGLKSSGRPPILQCCKRDLQLQSAGALWSRGERQAGSDTNWQPFFPRPPPSFSRGV